jgi:VWFA-related protein
MGEASVNHSTRRTFLAALTASAALRAQPPIQAPAQAGKPASGDEGTVFSSDVKVVNVLASVRDKQGKVVSVLGKDDFTVTEDGRPQTIKYFSHETDLPLTLGLLVDTSLSQRRVLGQERSASFRFLDRVLRADKDLTFVIHFDHDTELLQDLTSSRMDLQRALDKLELADSRRGNGGGGYPGGGYPGGGYPSGGSGGRIAGTTLYDAIYLASNDIMKAQKGRKAVILLTDGEDNGSKTYLNDAIEAAQRSDTIAYSILFTDDEQSQPMVRMGGGRRGGMRQPMPVSSHRGDGKKILERISRETGGAFFEVSKKLSIDEIFDRIQEELRNQYSIGYTSDSTSSSGFRAIKVTVKQSGMKVQAREGYYPR